MLHFCFSAPGIPPGLLDRSLFLSTLLLYAVRLFRQFSNPPNLGPFSGEICVNLYVYSIFYVYIQILCNSRLYIFPYFFKNYTHKSGTRFHGCRWFTALFPGQTGSPPRSTPYRAVLFVLWGVFSGRSPGAGQRIYPRSAQGTQTPAPLVPGCTWPPCRSGGPGAGRRGHWSSPCRAARPRSAPYRRTRALARMPSQTRPLFFST